MTSSQDHKAVRKALEWESYPARGVRYAIRPDTPVCEPGDEQAGPSDPTPAGDPREAVRLLREYVRLRSKIEYGLDDDDRDDEIAAESPAPPAVSRADAVRLSREHVHQRTGIEHADHDQDDNDQDDNDQDDHDDEIASELPAPLPEPQRSEIEDRLGVPLPADLRALYAVADGDDQAGLFQRLSWWVDLEGLAKVYRGDRHWGARGGSDVPRLSFLYDSQPPGVVRRATDRAGWIPFVLGTGGDYLAVDMDPGPNGRPGQVIRIGSDSDDGPVYVTDSVTGLLRKLVMALASGDYELLDGEELYIEVEPDWRDIEEHRDRAIDGANASLDRLRPEVQHLTVTNVDQVDLEAVRGAPILRWVQLSGRTTAELGPLQGAPVEILDLDLETIDLTPLAGHPTLRSVALKSTSPVDIRPLRTCPHLYALDLSNAPVDDIAAIAELDGLRYLSLRHRQWLDLWECADRLPPLATAFLAGKASQEAAVDWAVRLHATTG